jgi:hypothetical protein
MVLRGCLSDTAKTAKAAMRCLRIMREDTAKTAFLLGMRCCGIRILADLRECYD